MTLSQKDPAKVALIIFVRVPELGKVKTRLAKSIGDQKALRVYKILLEHTYAITSPLLCTKFVFYSDCIPTQDIWSEPPYQRKRQSGISLGDRMASAFLEVFSLGFTKVLIIGSDCYELNTQILNQSIEELESHDVVIGPANDGGYYLLGMNQFIPELFADKKWSTDTVARQTIEDLNFLQIRYKILGILNDIDEEIDLEKSGISLSAF